MCTKFDTQGLDVSAPRALPGLTTGPLNRNTYQSPNLSARTVDAAPAQPAATASKPIETNYVSTPVPGIEYVAPSLRKFNAPTEPAPIQSSIPTPWDEVYAVIDERALPKKRYY